MSDDDYEPQHSAEPSRKLNLMFGNAMYDRLKFLAQVLLPAVGTLYFTLSTIWGLPAADQVVGSIMAFDAFLGAVLLLSSTKYKAETEGKLVGFIDFQDTVDGKRAVLNFPGDPLDIVNHDKVTFKVRTN